MLGDLASHASKYRLKSNWDKTKNVTNVERPDGSRIACQGVAVHVLSGLQSEKYLGHKLSMLQYHTTELDNRLACAWAAFFKFKGVFCDPRLPVKEHFNFFSH